MLNLSIALEEKSSKTPNQIAIISKDKKISFGQLNQFSNKVANMILSLGIKPGQSIVLQCPNIWFFPVIYFGILKMGGIVVPISILLKKKRDKLYFK